MKILFFCHYFPPEVNAPASRTYEHAVRWVKAGHDVTVVTCVPNCPDGVVFEGYRNRLRSQTEMVDGIRVVRVWTWIAPNKGTIGRILNYLSYMLSSVWSAWWLPRPDVEVSTSPQFFCGWAGVLYHWLTRVPFVVEIRDIWPESISAVGAMKKGLATRFLEWMERRMYLAADQIVTVGHGYREQIAAKVPVGDRITVVMNGVDTDFFTPRPHDEAFLAKWGLTGKFVCSYVGTIGMAHGLEVVIRAAQLLKDRGRSDIAFLIVGDGARREELQRQTTELGLTDLVVWTGRMSRDQMPTVLGSSDACLVHLRKTELFETVVPSKIFETMAMGRPIIMGVRGESCQIVKDAGAAIEMEPESEQDLVTALIQMTDEPELQKHFSSSAREHITTHYHRDRQAARMLDVFHKAIP
jgi:glycosyltransferase involved in cell wall biosynthesis